MTKGEAAFKTAMRELSSVVIALFEASLPIRMELRSRAPDPRTESFLALAHERERGRAEHRFAEQLTAASSMFLTGAEDHARALATLLRPGWPPVLAYHTVGRAAVEYLSRSYLLLEPEAAFDLRVARWFNEQLESLQRLKTQARKIPGLDAGSADDEIVNLLELARATGFEVVEDQGRWVMERRTHQGDAIEVLLRSDVPSPYLASLLYWRMSGMAHGRVDVLRDAFDKAAGGIAGSGQSTSSPQNVLVPPVRDVSMVCEAVVHCTYVALVRFLNYGGADPGLLSPVVVELHEVLRRYGFVEEI